MDSDTYKNKFETIRNSNNLTYIVVRADNNLKVYLLLLETFFRTFARRIPVHNRIRQMPDDLKINYGCSTLLCKAHTFFA